MGTCAVCLDDFEAIQLNQLRCGHLYCGGCLRTVFIRATNDETEFPPRCCKIDIPTASIAKLFTRQEHLNYLRAKAEFSTPAPERLYCAHAACAKFIPPGQRLIAQCMTCREYTCRVCRKAHGVDDECQGTVPDLELATLAHNNGWRKCTGCGLFVERAFGCEHIV
jgi:hypothetical protein